MPEIVAEGKIKWTNAKTNWVDNAGRIEFILTYSNPSAIGTLKLPGVAQAWILEVGGGGAGGSGAGYAGTARRGAGGGGGGGGYVEASGLMLSGGDYTITVGAGGARATDNTVASTGNNGGSSYIRFDSAAISGVADALGGGGGGANGPGAAGASGGGGSGKYGTPQMKKSAGGAGTAGQGYDGGAGNNTLVGAGGGGAGAIGGTTAAATPGDGGNGLQSAISGTATYYGGGGGGGARDSTSVPSAVGGVGGAGGGGTGGSDATVEADVHGKDGLGGGGGGNCYAYCGGKGGNGVVIIRILEALDGAIVKPTSKTLTYNGENQYCANPSIAYDIVGVYCATNAGTYEFTAKLKPGYAWEGGGTEDVKVTWWITSATVNVPEVRTGLVYNGQNQIGVGGWVSYGYTMLAGGVTNATNAGSYQFTLRLNNIPGRETPNLVWASPAGSTADKTLSWSIGSATVGVPAVRTGLVYSITNQIGIYATTENAYTMLEGGVTNATNAGTYHFTLRLNNIPGRETPNLVWASPQGSTSDRSYTWSIASRPVDLPACVTNTVYNGKNQIALFNPGSEYNVLLRGDNACTNATHAGEYHFELDLKNPDDDTHNYVWNVKPASWATWLHEWSITQATNAIKNLQLKGWMSGTTGGNEPTCTCLFGVPSYSYSEASDGPWLPVKPTEPGDYWVKADVAATADYKAATAKSRFSIWASAGDVFTDYVDLTFNGNGATTILGVPVLVRISEARLTGFTYERAGYDPEKLMFLDPEDGTILSYDVDTWDYRGESLVWVRIPYFRPGENKIRMYWRLREGKTAPGSDPMAVWDGYYAVWHMADSTLTNSTRYAAETITELGPSAVSTDESLRLLGNSYGIAANGAGGPIFTCAKTNSLDELVTGGTGFTVSFWMRGAQSEQSKSFLFSRKTGFSSAGYGLRFGTDGAGSSGKMNEMTVFADATHFREIKGLGALERQWHHVAVAFSNNYYSLWIDGVRRSDSGSWLYTALNSDFDFAVGGFANATNKPSFAGSIDEFRIRYGVPKSDAEVARLTNDVATVGDADYMRHGFVSTDGVYNNYWLRRPSIAKSVYDGEVPKLSDVDMGLPATGKVSVVYRNTLGEETTVLPTARGYYIATFTVPATELFTELTATAEFRIAGHIPYSSVGGSSSGRILLMNNDAKQSGQSAKPEVATQGWADTSPDGETYWRHCNDIWATNSSGWAVLNLARSTESILFANGGRKLWHLFECRHGNTYRPGQKFWETVYPPAAVGHELWQKANAQGSTALASDCAYLPWGSTSQSIISTDHKPLPKTDPASQQLTGQLLMRNTTEAQACSPLYEEGIGTIYFDVVNMKTINSDASAAHYGFVVEICTNVLGSADKPTDAAIVHVEDIYDPVTTQLVRSVTNHYMRADWKPAAMTPTKIEGYATKTMAACQEFFPAIQTGGRSNQFYRVRVPLDIRVPARFRIRRTGEQADTPRDAVLLIFDNIIVSYPQMWAELKPRGVYDETRICKRALGDEKSFTVPFPSCRETVYGRAEPVYYTNSGTNFDVRTFFASAKMHYRWRYLSQQYSNGSAGDTGWNSCEIDPYHGFLGTEPLAFSSNLPGDLEFYFTANLETPYYTYVDYSGTTKSNGADLGVPNYTEEKTTGTYRAPKSGVMKSSMGTDWFVRQREGKSDYEDVVIHVRVPEDLVKDPTNPLLFDPIYMELKGDRQWRGFVPTVATTNITALEFRVEGVNPQFDHDAYFTHSTNYLYVSEKVKAVPITEFLVAGTTNDWTRIPCDSLTGALMFQFDDSTYSLTVNHADYQHCNYWHDANTTDGAFVGISVEDTYKSGTSPFTRGYRETFANWTCTPATDEIWCEWFNDNDKSAEWGYDNHPGYIAFSSSKTPNGWQAGPGMWVAGRYRDKDTNMALQMAGQGQGYVQFVDNENRSPRGIESVNFTARTAQYIDFDDFEYYDGVAPKSLTDYAFSSYVAFDTNCNQRFTGDASLSLVARYRPKIGCYEARWEQLLQVRKTSGDELVPGNYNINTNGYGDRQRLCLYRWSKNPTGKVTSTLVAAFTNSSKTVNFAIPATSGIGGLYMPMFISVESKNFSLSGGTRSCPVVTVGFRRTVMLPGQVVDFSSNMGQNKNWVTLTYVDTTDAALASGTYGVLSANCPGTFCKPIYFNQPVTRSTYPTSAKNWISVAWDEVLNFSPVYTACRSEFINDLWSVDGVRMAYFEADATISGAGSHEHQFGLMGQNIDQDVDIYFSPCGKTDWTLAGSVKVDGFGASAQQAAIRTYYFWTNEFLAVKLAHRGTLDDYRNDIAIDDIVVRQWRGDNYGSKDTVSYCSTDADYGFRTNWIFTSCWVTNVTARPTVTNLVPCVKMSAKRTKRDTPCSIRSPLLDGLGKPRRGVGLGMISFDYRNAQEDVNLLVQIATNVTTDATTINQSLDPSVWITVTNFYFISGHRLEEHPGAVTNLEMGTCSVYLGLHGVQGCMRLLMDPKLVNELGPETRPWKFGEIDITEVYCRDEPVVDQRCWWGWNLRACGYNPQNVEEKLSYDTGAHSYLPDFATSQSDAGLSIALNKSIVDDIRPEDRKTEWLREHMPFVQSPTFTSNIVGEVLFKARKYDPDKMSQNAELRLYGAQSGNMEDEHWTELAHFIVSNETYQTYSYRCEDGNYRAFRFGVTGLTGVNLDVRGPAPTEGKRPVRVLVDELMVLEPVRPTMGFRYCYPFRTDLERAIAITNIYACEQQPLIGESWSAQAEVFIKQLPEEVDLKTPSRRPRVFFHWYADVWPWGYQNWKDSPKAKTAEITRADGEEFIFRGGFRDSPEAVVDPATGSVQVVQYSVDVVYYNTSGYERTNTIDFTEWERPKWYDPIDYNASMKGGGFSPFTILETISPDRAWINEINVFDGRTLNWSYPGDTNQYIEIAAPEHQSLAGWRLDYINNSGKTNVLCTFGKDGVAAMKTLNATNEYVFITVQSPKTRDAHSLDPAKGEVDGTWADFNKAGATLEKEYPVALRLVRPSLVVEQEVVFEGTNTFYGKAYEARYGITNYLAKIQKGATLNNLYIIGNEYGNKVDESLGVFRNTGAVSNDWNNIMKKTPGRVNGDQIIPENWVIYVNGQLLIIRARLAGDGHVRQTFGDVVDSFADALATAPKGGLGTNIVYRIDPWWELAYVTTNGIPIPEAEFATNICVLTIGAGQSNDVTVVAGARVRKDLREEWGIDEQNAYTPAVMDWLAHRTDIFGNEWQGDKLSTNQYFREMFRGNMTPLSLTERYWLDIDPTVDDTVFTAGVVEAPRPVLNETWLGPDPEDPEQPHYQTLTNLRIKVCMYITNDANRIEAYSPYVLRGLAPGENSFDYTLDSPNVWTSVTFKVTGDIQNGKAERVRFIPLRWFVFNAESFSNDNHCAVIDISDPFSGTGPTADWKPYKGCPVFYSWAIDERLMSITVEPLKADSRLSE